MQITNLSNLLSKMSLAFGLMYVFLLPPFQSPDEYNHFFRAYQVSEGVWLPVRISENTAENTTNSEAFFRLGGYLPCSLDTLRQIFLRRKNQHQDVWDLATFKNALKIPLAAPKTQFTDFANTGIYAPIGYLPQAFAILLLKQFGFSPIYMVWLGRVFNYMAWWLVVSAALRRLGAQKLLWTFAFFLPAGLVMAASLNPEVLVCASVVWFLATFRSQAISVFVFSIQKIVLAPLALLVFAKNVEEKSAFKFGIIVLAVVSSVGWGCVAQKYFVPYAEYDPNYRTTQTLNEGTDPTAQLSWILQHPAGFVGVVAKSFVKSMPSTAAHLVGKFGWMKNYLPSPVLGLLWAVLLLLLFSEENQATFRQKWLSALAFGLFFIGFAVFQYANWCSIGSPELDVWQGRYFVPLLPLLFWIFGRKFFSTPHLEKVVLVVFLLGHFSMIGCIWIKFWLIKG